MDSYKREFISFLEDAGVLKFGDFTAKSGRKIPYFLNAGTSRPARRYQSWANFTQGPILKTSAKKEPFSSARHIRAFR